jgi:hypothetical protein
LKKNFERCYRNDSNGTANTRPGYSSVRGSLINPMKFKLQTRFLFKGLRLGRKSPPNLWQFGLAVHDVVAARTLLAVSGKLSAAEAHRMVDEKRSAAFRAQLACTEAILHGRGASAANAYFDVYHRAVKSNRKRLRRRRWRWPRVRF